MHIFNEQARRKALNEKKERRAREKEKKHEGEYRTLHNPVKSPTWAKAFFEREKINPIKKL